MFNDCIIMAGGGGTRLWPASSSHLAKQFLPLPVSVGTHTENGSNFFNAAVERALAVIDRKSDSRVIIIAGRSHIQNIIKSCQSYPNNIKKYLLVIPEPKAKSTAPAIACALYYIDWMSGQDRKVLVLTSDHIISPISRFKQDAEAAEKFAQADRLAIFGIHPTRPDTGYGYIETEKLVSQEKEDPMVYKVLKFREKPNLKTAEEFCAAGNFFWNSGMFAFSSRFMLEELRTSAPDVINPFGKLRAPDERSFKVELGIRILWEWLELKEAYEEAPAISFDYAIAEKCSNTIMVRAGFEWLDVGSWDEYASLLEKNKQSHAEVYQYGSKNCFVDSDIPVALAGLDDLIVVISSGKDGSPPAALITRKGETQHVRNIVEQIKKAGRTGLL